MTSSYMEMVQSGQSSRIQPNYGYYRQDNGWITVAVTTELEELRYRRDGWEPLSRYGKFDMTSEYAAEHPLELLFIKGGAKELPLEQVIQCGFHLNPPIVPSCGRALTQAHKWHVSDCWIDAQPVRFPQLDNLDWEDLDPEGYQCRFCDRAPFPTDKARDQHESVVHQDAKSDVRTAESLAGALVKGLKGETLARAPASQYVPDDALVVLANVGLNKRQIEALRAAGIEIPEVEHGDEEG